MYFWLAVIILHFPDANDGCLWNPVTLRPKRHLTQQPLCFTSLHRVTQPEKAAAPQISKQLYEASSSTCGPGGWRLGTACFSAAGQLGHFPVVKRRFVALLTLFHVEGGPFDSCGLARLKTDENLKFVHLAVLQAGGCIKSNGKGVAQQSWGWAAADSA